MLFRSKLRKLYLEKGQLEPDAYLEKPPEAEELLKYAGLLSEGGSDITGGGSPAHVPGKFRLGFD